MTAYGGSPATSFKYADPATGTVVTDTFASTDVFMVDGVTATFAVFMAELSAGAVVTVLPNTPTTGVTTYKLVNKVPADYASGLIGSFVTPNFTINEPISGVVLNTIDDAATAFMFYTVGGATVSKAVFESSVQPGDTVVVTGTGVDASHIRTIALTNVTVSGTVVDAVPANGTFYLKSAGTFKLGEFDATFGTPAMTVDGVIATIAEFKAALSDGDTGTFSKVGGATTITLVNVAPALIHGQIISATLAGGQITDFTYIPTGDVSTTVTVVASIALTVDGALASDAEFKDAVTLGDTVVYRAADVPTSTTSRLELTNAIYSGTVDPTTTDVGTQVVGVFAAGSDTEALGAALDYTSPTVVGLTGTTVEYRVNGVVKLIAPFETSLAAVDSGALTGTITVTQTGTKTIFALTTAIA